MFVIEHKNHHQEYSSLLNFNNYFMMFISMTIPIIAIKYKSHQEYISDESESEIVATAQFVPTATPPLITVITMTMDMKRRTTMSINVENDFDDDKDGNEGNFDDDDEKDDYENHYDKDDSGDERGRGQGLPPVHKEIFNR